MHYAPYALLKFNDDALLRQMLFISFPRDTLGQNVVYGGNITIGAARTGLPLKKKKTQRDMSLVFPSLCHI